eukprot:2752714-Prymnesium_polylepis.1
MSRTLIINVEPFASTAPQQLVCDEPVAINQSINPTNERTNRVPLVGRSGPAVLFAVRAIPNTVINGDTAGPYRRARTMAIM